MQRPEVYAKAPVDNQREVAISIDKWGGAYTAYPVDSVPYNSPWRIMNMDYVDQHTLTSRPGTEVFLDNSVHGQGEIREVFEFRRTGDVAWNIVYAHESGDLYSVPSTGGTPTLLGTFNTDYGSVVMEQLKDKLYIADGDSLQCWDGTNPITTVTLPNSSKPVWALEFNSRLWVLCSDNYLYGSVTNDPDTYTGGDSVFFRIANGDGMSAMSLARWTGKLLITKGDSRTQSYALYQLLGTSTSDYEIVPAFGDRRSPVGYLGKSAILIGNDVLGLMPDGFVTASGINTFNEVKLSPLSLPIDDVVRAINFNIAALSATAVYDSETGQYLCAVPSEGGTRNDLIIVFDVKQARWGFYSGWYPTKFFKIGKRVYFADRDGVFYQTRVGHSDNGNGYPKYVETGSLNGDDPDSIKMWKSIECTLEQQGAYGVDVHYILDDAEPSNSPVTIQTGNTSLAWDTWVWGVDKWSKVQPTRNRVLVLGRSRGIRIRVYNDRADEPFTVRRITARGYATDSGPAAA